MCKRTMKYFLGLSVGTWIVSTTWIDACLAAKCVPALTCVFPSMH